METKRKEREKIKKEKGEKDRERVTIRKYSLTERETETERERERSVEKENAIYAIERGNMVHIGREAARGRDRQRDKLSVGESEIKIL